MLIDDNDIRMLDKIGEGAHGIVHEGIWQTKNGTVSKYSNKWFTMNFPIAKGCYQSAN